MKALILIAAILTIGCDSNHRDGVFNIAGNSLTELTADSVTLLRNPCMGWGLYDDASDDVQNAAAYWAAQDAAARKYASFFYVRWRWSDMEPEEGKYAWEVDENYKALIQGALDRGLRLAFRVYDNGQDNVKAGTPDFVRKAGAQGYEVTGGGGKKFWTAYSDDTVFQEKWANFIRAFAAQYDDAQVVDFIDGFNLGWWGEGHHVNTKKPNNYPAVFDWVTDLYSQSFQQVIPIQTLEGHNYDQFHKRAYNNKGYGIRRDGLGSMWFTDREQQIMHERFPGTLSIGESCWWQGSTDDYRPWDSDTKYKFNSWVDVYKLTYEHAVNYHFNTLDLREQAETKGWTERAPELVQAFIVNGGYRFTPTLVSAPQRVRVGDTITIGHQWQNMAMGFFPNSNPKWNYKFKPAFALLDSGGNVVQLIIDTKAEPSEWIKGKEFRYAVADQVDQLPEGNYTLAVAIVNTQNENRPEIKLAIADTQPINRWYPIGSLEVEI